MIETAEQAAHRIARAAEREELATLRREMALATKELAAAREQRDRYERGLKAFARFVDSPNVSPADAREWLIETVTELLDGLEATCPICSTHVHEGACVVDEDEGDEGEDEPVTCDACGDTRGACIHV